MDVAFKGIRVEKRVSFAVDEVELKTIVITDLFYGAGLFGHYVQLSAQ